MKSRTKFLVMAMVAMFAFSTPADAQWGGLLNKARKAVGIKTKQEKAIDEQKRKQDSIQAAIKSITPTIPQPAESGALIAIRWDKTKIGTWDPVKLEITFNKTYEDGEFAGQKVSYKLDPNTGKWTSKKGSDVGSISNDGTIESPNLGTLKFDPEKCTVSYEGTIIGKANLKNAYIFDKEIGGFEGHVSPLLVAYTFIGALVSKDQVLKWKEEKEQRAKAAAERAEKERQERIAREEALKKEWASLNMEITTSTGSTLGYIRTNGVVENSTHSTIGYIKTSGEVEGSTHSTIGYIRSNGEIENSSHSTIGYYRNGCFEDWRHSTVGYFRNGDVEGSTHSTIGKIRGGSNSTAVAAAVYFFFFKDKIESNTISSSGRDAALYYNGSQFGEIRSNGDVYIRGSRKGELRSNGDIYVNGSRVGEIRSGGDIYKNGSRVGEVRSNGDVYENGSRVGEVRSNGDVYKNGSRIGEVRNMGDPKKAAVLYFFGFF